MQAKLIQLRLLRRGDFEQEHPWDPSPVTRKMISQGPTQTLKECVGRSQNRKVVQMTGRRPVGVSRIQRRFGNQQRGRNLMRGQWAGRAKKHRERKESALSSLLVINLGTWCYILGIDLSMSSQQWSTLCIYDVDKTSCISGLKKSEVKILRLKCAVAASLNMVHNPTLQKITFP